MALEPDQAGRDGFRQEGLVQGFVVQEERHVHARAHGRIDFVAIEPAGLVDRGIQQRGLARVAAGEFGHAAFVQHPFHGQAQHVPVPAGRRVEHGFRLQLAAVIEDVRARLASAFQQAAADDHHADADRSQVLLRAGIDDAELRNIQRLGRDGGTEVGEQRDIARLPLLGVMLVAELDAMDGFIGGEVYIGGVGRQLPLAARGD